MGDVIGVIGLGVMGSAMAQHVSGGGHHVRGYDIDEARRESSAVVPCASVTDVARATDVIVLSLPSVDALEEVVRETAASARSGSVVIEMSTLPLDAKFAANEVLAGAGIHMLDAPVSGTGLQAADGTLVVYCSGPTSAYRRVRPLFELIGKQSYDLGEFGNGSRMKFVANMLVAVHTLAAAEAHALGAAAGLDPTLVQEVISAGVGSSRIFDIRGPMMAADRFDPPSARLAIILKDARIISEYARSVGASSPLLDAALPMYEAGVSAGLGDLDAAALRTLFR